MRLAAGAATAGVAYKAGQRRAEQDQYEQDQYANEPAPADSSAGGSGAVADLDHLVELHKSGGLSDEEFAAAKANLLGL
jgi:hypothetical protein